MDIHSATSGLIWKRWSFPSKAIGCVAPFLPSSWNCNLILSGQAQSPLGLLSQERGETELPLHVLVPGFCRGFPVTIPDYNITPSPSPDVVAAPEGKKRMIMDVFNALGFYFVQTQRGRGKEVKIFSCSV